MQAPSEKAKEIDLDKGTQPHHKNFYMSANKNQALYGQVYNGTKMLNFQDLIYPCNK